MPGYNTSLVYSRRRSKWQTLTDIACRKGEDGDRGEGRRVEFGDMGVGLEEIKLDGENIEVGEKKEDANDCAGEGKPPNPIDPILKEDPRGVFA